jgi:hypothetical protein
VRHSRPGILSPARFKDFAEETPLLDQSRLDDESSPDYTRARNYVCGLRECAEWELREVITPRSVDRVGDVEKDVRKCDERGWFRARLCILLGCVEEDLFGEMN